MFYLLYDIPYFPPCGPKHFARSLLLRPLCQVSAITIDTEAPTTQISKILRSPRPFGKLLTRRARTNASRANALSQRRGQTERLHPAASARAGTGSESIHFDSRLVRASKGNNNVHPGDVPYIFWNSRGVNINCNSAPHQRRVNRAARTRSPPPRSRVLISKQTKTSRVATYRVTSCSKPQSD